MVVVVVVVVVVVLVVLVDDDAFGEDWVVDDAQKEEKENELELQVGRSVDTL